MISLLENLSTASAEVFGGKAGGLAQLHKIGAPIPETLCLSIEFSDLETLSQNQELLLSISQWISCFSNCYTWIVRSSHFYEDSMAASSAGLYASCIVEIPENQEVTDLIKAIKTILQPVFQNCSRSAVLIQPFKFGRLSGVLFSSDPNVGLQNEGIITVVDGPCSSLVDGSANPKAFHFTQDKIPMDLPSPLNKHWDELLMYSRMVEKNLGVPIDIEFTIDDKDRLFLLQVRPIATLTAWKDKFVPILVSLDAILPSSVQNHPKVQLRMECERHGILISPAWIVTETIWNQLSELNLPDSSYACVLVHPPSVNGKVHRMFSNNAFVGVSKVLRAANNYWIRHAIIKEIFASELTGVAILNGGHILIEVAKGHFIPKGIVDTTIYEVKNNISRLVHQQKQEWFFDIDLDTGEATKHHWGGYPLLNPKQLDDIVNILHKLGLNTGDYLEFGIDKNGEIFIIDTQSSNHTKVNLLANEQIISLGQAEGQLCYISNCTADATGTHFFDFISNQPRNSIDLESVVVASWRPELGLLLEFAKLINQKKRIVGAIFGIYSPLCHLAILLREWSIPAIVIPELFKNQLPDGVTVRIKATITGGSIDLI